MQTINMDLSLFREGGLMMWPIMILALVGLLIFVERVLYLHKGQIRTDTFITGIKNLLEKDRVVEALTVCEETPGPVAAIIKAAILNRDKGQEQIRGAIQGAAIIQIPALERRVASMAAIARVAPLLGLLGTVLGMVDALFGIHAGGAYANMGTVSGGFAAALISTAFGLAIAIVAHLAFHFLSGRVRALVSDMEYAGHEITQTLLFGTAPSATANGVKTDVK
jgi:biopolymer transport protein ExbB